MPTIAVFGISGRLGQALAAEARARRWGVRSFSRISSVVPVGTAAIHGRFEDDGRVREVVRATDGVCCVFGPRSPFRDVFCAAATRTVLAAMEHQGIGRLLCVTGAMVGDTPSRSRAMGWMAAWFRRRRPAVAADRAEQERLVAASPLDWTILKPPRLTEADATGRVVAGEAVPVGLLSSLTRADLARFMLDEIAAPRHRHARIVVRNGT